MQVTNEMVEAAWAAWCSKWHQSKDWQIPMRAALEAALAVRIPVGDAGDIIARLRRKLPALGIIDCGVPMTLMDRAADLIERQVEEIAQLNDFTASLENQGDALSAEVNRLTAQFDDGRTTELFIDTIRQLTTERAELIEALRLFVYPIDNAIQRAVALDSARDLLERLGAVIRD